MICLVLGMHRTGTSLVAGLLHESGVPMGSSTMFLPRPSEENPLGFYEDVRFRVVNDALLARSRYRVKSWRVPVPDVGESRALGPVMGTLVRRGERQAGPWGWKDPRQLLTLRAWRPVFAATDTDVRVAWVHRHPEAVAISMMQRRNVTEPRQALALYEAYTERALATLADWQPALRVLRYEELLRDPIAGVGPLAELIDHDIPVDVIDRQLRPRRARPACADDDSELLERLRSLER